MGKRMYATYVKRRAKEQRGNVLGFIFGFEALLCFLLAFFFGKTPLDRLSTEWQWITHIVWSALIVTAILWFYVRIFGWPSIDLRSCIVLLIQSSAAACICMATGTIATQIACLEVWFKLTLVLFGYLTIGVMLVHLARTNRAHAQQRWRQVLALYAYPPLVFAAVYSFTHWYFNIEATNGVILLVPIAALGMLVLSELSGCLPARDTVQCGVKQKGKVWFAKRNKACGTKTSSGLRPCRLQARGGG